MFVIYHGVEAYSIGDKVCNVALPSGTAVQLDASGNYLVAATGDPLGFLEKSVTADGPSDWEMETLKGISAHEVQTGNPVPVVDGPGLIKTDRVAATISGASIGDQLTIKNGVWDVCASGDIVCGKLEKTDPDDDSDTYLIRRLLGGTIKGE